MEYRTLFFEFLSNYREYHFDTFQLLLFDNNEQDNILKVINNKESVDIYQVKNAQTYYKKVPFSNLSSTVANLLFVSDQPAVLEVSKVDNDLRKYFDLYNGKSIYDLNCKYLLIYPIFKKQQLLGGLFIYSNYQIIWKIQENKVLKFLNDLENANCLDIINEINTNSKTKYWIYSNKGFYLSEPLKNLLNCNSYNITFNVQGNSLKKVDEFAYLNGTVNVYEPIEKKHIESIIEIQKLKLSKYTLVYTRALEDEDILEHVNKVEKIVEKIDGMFGTYHLYQTSSNSIIIVFENELSKKDISSYFNNISYILVRSGAEIKKMADFAILVDYLNLSPIEDFNNQYYEYYYNSLLSERREQVLSNYTPSKIQITPLINAKNMQIDGYLVKDLYDLTNASKDNKLKSIKAITKTIEEYKDFVVYLDLSLKDIMNGSKVHVAYLNVLKKIVEAYNCYFLIDYNKELFYEISKLWDNFPKTVIVKEQCNDYVEVLTLKDSVQGICLSSKYYSNLINVDEKAANELTDLTIKSFKRVIVQTSQSNITKYNNKSVLLFCVGA